MLSSKKLAGIIKLKVFPLLLEFLYKKRGRVSIFCWPCPTAINLTLLLRELLGPVVLSRAQVFCIHEVAKVVVACKNKNLMLTTFEVVSPSFENFNNGQKPTIVGFVLRLSLKSILLGSGFSLAFDNFLSFLDLENFGLK